PGIGEQGIIRVQHAFRNTRRSGRKGQTYDLVRIRIQRLVADDLPLRIRKRDDLSPGGRLRAARSTVWRDMINTAYDFDSLCGSKDIGAFSVRTVTWLREERRSVYALQQLDHTDDRVVLMQRSVADVTVARARQINHANFRAARQEDRHTRAAAQTCV